MISQEELTFQIEHCLTIHKVRASFYRVGSFECQDYDRIYLRKTPIGWEYICSATDCWNLLPEVDTITIDEHTLHLHFQHRLCASPTQSSPPIVPAKSAAGHILNI